MASAGRPSKLTPELRGLIDTLRPQARTQGVLLKMLKQRGHKIGITTLRKHLASTPQGQQTGTLVGAGELLGLSNDAEELTEGDEVDIREATLSKLRRWQRRAEQLIEGYQRAAEHDRMQITALKKLHEIHGAVSRQLFELTPKTDEEKAGLEALGEEKRQELLKRIREQTK